MSKHVAELAWSVAQAERYLDLLARYEQDATIRSAYEKGFILATLLEDRGTLRRLRAAVESAADEQEARELLRRVESFEAAFARSVATVPGILDALHGVLTPGAFLRALEAFVQPTRTGRRARTREDWEEQAEEAADLFLERDRLALILRGAEEMVRQVSPADEARQFLAESHAVAERADEVLRQNLAAFGPARQFLGRYRARFNAGATGEWWWQVKLPETPAPPSWTWSGVLAAVRERAAGILPISGMLLRAGRELVEATEEELQAMLEALRRGLETRVLEPGILHAADHTLPVQPVQLVDADGTELSEVQGLVVSPGRIVDGQFELVLQLPDARQTGSPAWVGLELSEEGLYVIPASVEGDVIRVHTPIVWSGTVELPGLRVAVLASSREGDDGRS